MNSWSPERIADRLQIQEVLYRYCRAIDRIQTYILASVFHPDAIVDKGDDRGSVTDFIAAVAARHPGVPHASHMVRSEERRVGKECVSTCRSRWSPYH